MGNFCCRRQQIDWTPPQAPTPTQMRATFDCVADMAGDLSFKRGDTFEVLDTSDSFWWKVKHLQTEEVGFVAAKQYLRECSDGPRSLDCWFEDYNRCDAERHLLMPGLTCGTYLLRPFHHVGSDASVAFVISVRWHTVDADLPQICHILVRSMGRNCDFYLEKGVTFGSVRALIEHYGEERKGYYRLLRECPTTTLEPSPVNRALEISIDRLKFRESLGDGALGEVHRAVLNGRIEVAVRRLALRLNNDESATMKKLERLHALHHSKLSQLLGVCLHDDAVWTVSEFVPLGQLDVHLRGGANDDNDNLDQSVLLDMLTQVADAMAYLESMGTTHRRLRAANILIGQNRCLKVTDFGLGQLAGAESRVRWTAVECLNDVGGAAGVECTVKSDVWSYGVVMYEIVTRGRLPYSELDDSGVVEFVTSGRRLPNPDGLANGVACSVRIYDLMLRCWSADPHERLTFQSLKETLEDVAKIGEEYDDYSN